MRTCQSAPQTRHCRALGVLSTLEQVRQDRVAAQMSVDSGSHARQQHVHQHGVGAARFERLVDQGLDIRPAWVHNARADSLVDAGVGIGRFRWSGHVQELW